MTCSKTNPHKTVPLSLPLSPAREPESLTQPHYYHNIDNLRITLHRSTLDLDSCHYYRSTLSYTLLKIT
jgi:hypothetical protein